MQTVVIGRTLFFNDEHKLLLLRRSEHETYRPGGIDLPGGKIEEQEDILTGTIREAAEETGLAVDPLAAQLVYAFTRADFNTDAKGDINAVGLFFACRTNNSTVALNPQEHDAFYWCTLDEAIEKADHKNHKMVLSHIREHNIASELWSNA